MEIKFLFVLQMAFDLVVGAMLLIVLFKKGERPGASESPNLNRNELEKGFLEWERAGNELVARLEAKIQSLNSASEELDRAEMRALETLDRLEKARLALASGEGAYGHVYEWIAQGVPLSEVAKRSGLGMGELRLMRDLRQRDGRFER